MMQFQLGDYVYIKANYKYPNDFVSDVERWGTIVDITSCGVLVSISTTEGVITRLYPPDVLIVGYKIGTYVQGKNKTCYKIKNILMSLNENIYYGVNIYSDKKKSLLYIVYGDIEKVITEEEYKQYWKNRLPCDFPMDLCDIN